MTTNGLTTIIEKAKAMTESAKAIKAWRLSASSRKVQRLMMPNGYILATDNEVAEILNASGKSVMMHDGNRKRVWAMHAFPQGARKFEVTLIPLA